MDETTRLDVKQGTDFSFLFQILDEADAGVDVTQWAFAGQVRKTFADTEIIASFAFDILDQTDPANVGWVRAKLAKAVTSAMPVAAVKNTSRPVTLYIFDIESTDLDDKVERPVEGVIALSPEVTRV